MKQRDHIVRAIGYVQAIKTESSKRERERLANAAIAALRSALLAPDEADR